MIAARITILAIALAAGAACQAQAMIRTEPRNVGSQPPAGKQPVPYQRPTHFCNPHYEWGPPASQRPQRPDEIYIYYVDFQCHKTLVRVIRKQKFDKVTR